MIRTRLTDLLGIACPVVQAAMGYVSGARLAAAVSQAGGLGLIASATMSPAELCSAIKEVRERTGAPFGVNLRADAPDARERAEMIIAEKVPVASFALAPRPELIGLLRDAGVVTIASVGARRHAEKVAAWGIDAVIATGGEGGGHTGAVPTSLLVPQVVDAVGVPVIAAGGFFDGRGLAAALAYGAAGIAMGTRFLLTSDSPVADAVKQVYLAAGLDGTVVTTRVDGVPHRVLRTTMVDHLEHGGKAGAPFKVTVDPGGPDERVLPGLVDDEPIPAGTLVRVETTGGGGWGDPLEREADLVGLDVLQGKVSARAAREEYGVIVRVIDGAALEIDAAATTALRARLRDRLPQAARPARRVHRRPQPPAPRRPRRRSARSRARRSDVRARAASRSPARRRPSNRHRCARAGSSPRSRSR